MRSASACVIEEGRRWLRSIFEARPPPTRCPLLPPKQADGAILTGAGSLNLPQLNILPSSPQVVGLAVMHPAQDALCASTMSTAAARTAGTAYFTLRCIGSFGALSAQWPNAPPLSINLNSPYEPAGAKITAATLASLPPGALRLVSLSRLTAAVGLQLPANLLSRNADNHPCRAVGGVTCIAWYGNEPFANLTLGGAAALTRLMGARPLQWRAPSPPFSLPLRSTSPRHPCRLLGNRRRPRIRPRPRGGDVLVRGV